MKPAGLIAREDAVRKPPHGSPCNRCGGVCCMVTLCAIALALLLVTGAAHAGECPDGTDGCDNEASPASLWGKALGKTAILTTYPNAPHASDAPAKETGQGLKTSAVPKHNHPDGWRERRRSESVADATSAKTEPPINRLSVLIAACSAIVNATI